MGFFGAQAQTQPVPDPPSPPGVPTRPMDPNDRPIQPTEPQQPVTPRANPSEGWIMFDERSTKDLELQQDQLQRLRDVDGRYSRDYSGMGKTPSTNPGYKTLSDRRDADVRGILTPDQYQRWKNMRSTPDDRMKRDTDGDRKDKGTTAPRQKAPGTVTPNTTPATTPEPKPKN